MSTLRVTSALHRMLLRALLCPQPVDLLCTTVPKIALTAHLPSCSAALSTLRVLTWSHAQPPHLLRLPSSTCVVSTQLCHATHAGGSSSILLCLCSPGSSSLTC